MIDRPMGGNLSTKLKDQHFQSQLYIVCLRRERPYQSSVKESTLDLSSHIEMITGDQLRVNLEVTGYVTVQISEAFDIPPFCRKSFSFPVMY